MIDIVKKDYSKPKARLNGNIIIDCIRYKQEFIISNSEWLMLNKFYKCQKCKKIKRVVKYDKKNLSKSKFNFQRKK